MSCMLLLLLSFTALEAKQTLKFAVWVQIMVSERYLHYPWAAYWVWGDPMLPAVSPYASLFPQSATFRCISTLTVFKQCQRFSLLAVCNVMLAFGFNQDVWFWVTAQSYRIAVVPFLWKCEWIELGMCFLLAWGLCSLLVPRTLFWSCQKLQAVTFRDMHSKILPWKSYSKRIMCICGKWGALEYNIIIPAKLVSRFIDLLHKGPSKIKQTWWTVTLIPWMLSVIHWPCLSRLVILPHAV